MKWVTTPLMYGKKTVLKNTKSDHDILTPLHSHSLSPITLVPVMVNVKNISIYVSYATEITTWHRV